MPAASSPQSHSLFEPEVAVVSPRGAVEREHELVLPSRKRISAGYEQTPEGQTEYRIYYGTKEVCFDEPELFRFAETLVRQERFRAESATSWGEGYTWEALQPLLSELVEQGILSRAAAEQERPGGNGGPVASELPPALGCVPRTWLECAALSEERAQRSVPLGYLELIVPVYRLVHPMLDRDQRQVGEGNVFPTFLRLDVATEWRRCQYPGSRYQDPCPMNVSALKAMIKHWKPILALLQASRARYLERFADARERMTLGHIERLSALVLALPTYLAMRAPGRVNNGDLHPVLSSLFRVTDGLRLSAHQMMLDFEDERGARDPDAQVTSSELFNYVERTAGFMSNAGVCAGPRHMIDEFLAVMVDGAQVVESISAVLDAELQAALAALGPAFDYGLLGLQAAAVTVSYWMHLTAGYQRWLALLDRGPALESRALVALRGLCAERVEYLSRTTAYVAERSRLPYERLYAETFRQASRGLGDADARGLAERFWVAPSETDRELKHMLHSALLEGLPLEGDCVEQRVQPLVAAIAAYFEEERRILALGSAVQHRINLALERERPTRALAGLDLCVYAWWFERSRPLPSPEQDLAVTLGVSVAVTSESLTWARQPAA